MTLAMEGDGAIEGDGGRWRAMEKVADESRAVQARTAAMEAIARVTALRARKSPLVEQPVASGGSARF
jgi:hypothetical protein